ncbi:hypothetical protein Cgig2_017526 [Carnegiea gigantea]|uniref:Aminotransferase-like plant mobile domain-containing protein n=1 Tax=Carnegiea gigantea TaxID=171969 RepID=A0A9Q1K3H4_9CARY|nr:hypothetical protein Cgig2_017526 [Carnegiea gigantea]
MVEKILERGDHGEEFQRDFVLHIISTSIIRSVDGGYFFRTLKLLMDVNQIPEYNWGAYLLFHGVEFREKRCKDRWFPTTIHWITDAVKQRSKDEKEFRREHGRLNKEIKTKRSFPEKMERVGQLIGKNIIRFFMKEKLNFKQNRHLWHQKTRRILNVRHQPMTLHEPLRNHLEERRKDQWLPKIIHWTTDAVK